MKSAMLSYDQPSSAEAIELVAPVLSARLGATVAVALRVER